MALRPETLPRDADQLIEIVLVCEGKIEALQATIAKLRTIIFGARSEKSAVIIAEQLSLALGKAETDSAVSTPANDDGQHERANETAPETRKKRHRNIGALPKNLPLVEVTIEPETTTCPCCAGALHCIGEDFNDVVDRAPAVLRILRTIRPKYACRACEGAVVQAKARPRLIESGMASTALVAWIAAAKYAWGSTLYRQTQILAGHGLDIDRQTLARWMKQAAWMVKGLYELQLTSMHGHARLFCDETPVRVLSPGRGRTKVCQFWAHATDDRSWKGPAPPAVAYVCAGGRGRMEIASQLAGFEGVLHVDGYAAYTALAGDKKKFGKIRLAFCLVHARRNFVDVHKTTNSPFAKEVIERIAAVYAIEKRIRGLDADQRRAVRQAETEPLMEALKARLEETKDGISRQSTLMGAIDYALERWAGLTLFLKDGRLEPDTNIVERSIRQISIGKKNSLFCGNEGGGETWAILASLLNTCKLHGVDPETYLTDVLERMVSGATKNNRLDELLVWNWKAAREAAMPDEPRRHSVEDAAPREFARRGHWGDLLT
jgi:transposase